MAVFIGSDRAERVLSHVIHIFLETRVPVSSMRIAQCMGLSSATMRSVMADLEKSGFLESPHCSAGRIPTPKTWRLYAQSILGQNESFSLSEEDKSVLSAMEAEGPLGQVSQTLADLCHGAGIFFSAPQDIVMDGLNFLLLGPGKCLCVLETSCGKTEYRVVSISAQITQEQLNQASEILNRMTHQRTISDALHYVQGVLSPKTECTHGLALQLLRKGVGTDLGALDIKGHSYLLDFVKDTGGMMQFKLVFSWLEKQKMLCQMLHRVISQKRLQVFFERDDGFDDVLGCSVVVAPYQAERNKGVVGVIGPLHMDYRRVIPIIDVMAKLVERSFK